ncbi:hypothetical protein [Paenibacillus agricola]|uniref:Uncharacterized protein n=1 Tax=Paenibacillus agricola TaxID=2716264 RepID=A0ABX0J6Q9_9BACL|nr:hypothetical protein [Paenibacillus agricola]NHN31066.1 hypothetical protein [Paenibacillus agricola]
MIRKVCKLDTDFQRSVTFQRPIEAWVNGKLDKVGKVESFSKEYVVIEGRQFQREHCEFWIV